MDIVPLKLDRLFDYGNKQKHKYLNIYERKDHLGGNVLYGDHHTYEQGLWEYLVREYKIKTVLDVGCGDGAHTFSFEELGCKAIGIDGCLPNTVQKHSFYPIVVCDLTKSFVQVGKVDLVWCCEVLEHIEERYIDNVMQTLLNGRILAMTHAPPNAEGHHHVNCRSTEYWLKLFASYGVYPIEGKSQSFFRGLGHEGGFFRNTGMVMYNKRWNYIAEGNHGEV